MSEPSSDFRDPRDIMSSTALDPASSSAPSSAQPPPPPPLDSAPGPERRQVTACTLGGRRASDTVRSIAARSVVKGIILFMGLTIIVSAVLQYRNTQNTKRTLRNQTAILIGAAKTRKIQENQHITQLAGCHRGNIKQIALNRSAQADYLVSKVTLTLLQVSIKRHPHQVGARQFDSYIPLLTNAVNYKDWVPLTNCVKAINEHGASYPIPEPVAFSKELPPPAAIGLPTPKAKRPSATKQPASEQNALVERFGPLVGTTGATGWIK